MAMTHKEFLTLAEQNPRHIDEDGLESPSREAIATARRIFGEHPFPRLMGSDGNAGVFFEYSIRCIERYDGPHTSIYVNEDGSVIRRWWFGEFVIKELYV